MPKLLGVCALALAAAACHQAAPNTDVTVTQPVAEAAAIIAANNRTPAAPPASPPLSPATRELLGRYDLTPLLGMMPMPGEEMRPHVQNGFFGPAHRRIEVVFTDVQRDATQPNVYYLRGKNRYKGIITPFAGTLTFTEVSDQPKYTKRELAEGIELENNAHAYTAEGNFELREEATQPHSGVFSGCAAVDWGLLDGQVRQITQTSHTPTQGGGVKFESSWTENGSATAKSVVWVQDIFTFVGGQYLLKNFTIGGRGIDFNPEYAKLGWNTYWTNDEWWVDSPKPSASL